MAEKVTIGNAELIHGDCLEVLPLLSFDAIVSDPPYGIAYQHSGGGKGLHSGMKAGQHHNFVGHAIAGDDARGSGVCRNCLVAELQVAVPTVDWPAFVVALINSRNRIINAELAIEGVER